jgi:hypothetical protein
MFLAKVIAAESTSVRGTIRGEAIGCLHNGKMRLCKEFLTRLEIGKAKSADRTVSPCLHDVEFAWLYSLCTGCLNHAFLTQGLLSIGDKRKSGE